MRTQRIGDRRQTGLCVCGGCQCAVTDMMVYLHPEVWDALLMFCVCVRENDYGNITPDVCFIENIGNVPP